MRRYHPFGSSRFRSQQEEVRGGQGRRRREWRERDGKGGGGEESSRSRGTRRRGSGRKREIIVRVSWWTSARDENRASRPATWKARLGPNRVREVGRLASVFLSFSFCSSSLLSSSASTASSSHSREAAIAFLFCLCCAALRCSPSLFLPPPPLPLSLALSFPLSFSLLRRAKMVHGRSRTPISPRILRGGSTSTPLYPAPLPLVLPLYSPRFFAPAASQSRRGFSSRYSFLYARDCIVHLFKAP